jgi:hypothetical protein
VPETKELKTCYGAEEVKNRPSQFLERAVSRERLFLSTGGARFVTKRRRREWQQLLVMEMRQFVARW